MHSNTLYRRARLQVKNGSRKPAWFDAASSHRPFEIGWTKYARHDPGKPKELSFPEDKLRKKFNQYYAGEAGLYVVDQIPGDNMWFQHPSDVFANKQLRLMENQGLTEDEAFEICAKEKALTEYSMELEEKYAVAAAESMGVKVVKSPIVPPPVHHTSDDLTRENLDVLRQLVHIKREAKAFVPFTWEELQSKDIRPHDVYSHISSNPADLKFFSAIIKNIAAPAVALPVDIMEDTESSHAMFSESRLKTDLMFNKEAKEDMEEDGETEVPLEERELDEEEVHPTHFELESSGPLPRTPFEPRENPPRDALDLFLDRLEGSHLKLKQDFEKQREASAFDPFPSGEQERTKFEEAVQKLKQTP